MALESVHVATPRSHETGITGVSSRLPRLSAEFDASSCYAVLMASRRLDDERRHRDADPHASSDRSVWVEASLVPAFEAMAAALRAEGVPARVERTLSRLMRLRIGDAHCGDVERWVEVNAYPKPICVMARVGRMARLFPACSAFPSEEHELGKPNQIEVGAWLETLVTQMFA